MKRKYKYAVLFCSLCCFLLITSCTSKREKENSEVTRNVGDTERVTELTIYMVGDEVVSSKGSYFTSMYSLGGDYWGKALAWGEKGHIYYDAIRTFEEDTGIELIVYCFDSTEEIYAQLEVDSKNGTMPDVIVGDANSGSFNVYSYLNSDYFVDLSGYLKENEGQYYERVLEGGTVNGAQYIMPLVFNMNVLFSSKRILGENGLEFYEYESYTQICEKLTELLRDKKDERGIAAVSELVSWLMNAPYMIIDGASGQDWFNYATGTPEVNEEYVYLLYDFEKARLEQEFGKEWDEIKQSAKLHQNILESQKSKSATFHNWMYGNQTFGDIYDLNIIMLEGGGHSTIQLRSALAQAVYMNSKYEDLDDELVYVAIPTYEDNMAYTANVTMYAGVTSQCEDAEIAFSFVKWLADYEVPWQMGLSIQKENTERMVEERRNTVYTLYPGMGAFDPEVDPENNEKWLGEPYAIAELDDEICDYFLDMLEHIGTATLPDGELRNRVYALILDGLLNDISKEQVYINICNDLQQYNGSVVK